MLGNGGGAWRRTVRGLMALTLAAVTCQRTPVSDASGENQIVVVPGANAHLTPEVARASEAGSRPPPWSGCSSTS
jgi:hypothetical protein